MGLLQAAMYSRVSVLTVLGVCRAVELHVNCAVDHG